MCKTKFVFRTEIRDTIQLRKDVKKELCLSPSVRLRRRQVPVLHQPQLHPLGGQAQDKAAHRIVQQNGRVEHRRNVIKT